MRLLTERRRSFSNDCKIETRRFYLKFSKYFSHRNSVFQLENKRNEGLQEIVTLLQKVKQNKINIKYQLWFHVSTWDHGDKFDSIVKSYLREKFRNSIGNIVDENMSLISRKPSGIKTDSYKFHLFNQCLF